MSVVLSASLTCVIIDDNEINRLNLEHFVELHDQLTLAASLADGMQALAFLRAGGRANIFLLDIEMPHINGLELIKLLPEPKPAIILVTTHPDFAVAAFDLHVTDYLVKPVGYARFCRAIALAAGRTALVSAEAATAEVYSAPDMFLKVNGKLVRINFNEVLYIEALSAYVAVVTAKQKHIITGTLKSVKERLPFRHFMQVHRSYIVNLHRVDAMQDNLLQLGSYQVPVGKSYLEEFSRRLRTF